MKKEDLEKLYRSWDKEKLFNAFKKRYDYTDEAQAVMLSVMKEKGFANLVDAELKKEKEQIVHEQIAVKVSLDAQQRKYETQMLGECSNAKQYASNNLANGAYMNGTIVSSKLKGIRTLLISFSIVGLVMSLLTLFINPFFYYAPLLFFGVTCFLAVGGYVLFKNSKASYRFYKEGNRDIVEVEQGDFFFKATVPFDYFVFWYMMEIHGKGVKVSHPVLGLGITNKEKETIILMGNLTALQDPPPAWPERQSVKIPDGSKMFNEVVGHQLRIVKFKKILDGLHEK